MRESPFKPIYDACNKGNSKEKHANLPEFPRLIDIELTNTCNFRCLMCPTGTFSQKRAKGFMTDAVFDKILGEIAGRGTALRFIRWGEPFLHERLFDHLRAARKADVLCHINTNGSFLDDHAVAELVDIPLAAIKFSFQGIDRKTYREVRNTDFFEDLVKTIARLHRARGARVFPHIHVATTITYESKEQVRGFRDRMAPIADLVTVGRTVLEHLDLDGVRVRPHEMEMLKRLKEQQSLVAAHPECPEVFDKMSVNWDGSVTACCGDHDNMMIIGDVRRQTMEDIWRSEKLDHYRGMLADMRHDELPLCKTCFDYNNLAVQDTEELIDEAGGIDAENDKDRVLLLQNR